MNSGLRKWHHSDGPLVNNSKMITIQMFQLLFLPLHKFLYSNLQSDSFYIFFLFLMVVQLTQTQKSTSESVFAKESDSLLSNNDRSNSYDEGKNPRNYTK